MALAGVQCLHATPPASDSGIPAVSMLRQAQQSIRTGSKQTGVQDKESGRGATYPVLKEMFSSQFSTLLVECVERNKLGAVVVCCHSTIHCPSFRCEWGVNERVGRVWESEQAQGSGTHTLRWTMEHMRP